MNSPRLHPDTIEEVKQRADIVDIVSEHVPLRKQGKDFAGLCPFHDEKSPSFTVSPSKQMYYCFGCAAGGNAIKFLMELSKRSFTEVVLDLAQRYQVPVKTLEPEQQQEIQRRISLQEQLYEILALAASFYQHALQQSQGEKALAYLQQQRQLNDLTIQQFKLGYAPDNWETLHHYLVDKKGFSATLVEQAGLIKPTKSGNKYIDLFRDRLIIPICDAQGRIIGFGGRSLGDEQPKYLNSPETPLFDKGKTLFALDKAKSAIAKQDQAIVVEGYFDAIALHAAGINNAVASLGTALSLGQVKQLMRYSESKQIVLNFDADKAGNLAAERAIKEVAALAYRGEVQLRVLNLPDGKDADEFLHQHSPEDYQQLLIEAPLWLDWQIQRLLKQHDIKQANGYQKAAEAMVQLLSQIANDNQLTHYLQVCAELLSQGDSRRVPLLSDNLLNQISSHWGKLQQQDTSLAIPRLVANRLKSNRRSPARSSQRKMSSNESNLLLTPEDQLLEKAEALLLRLYLHCPEYRQAVIEALDECDLPFSLPHHRFLWEKVLQFPASEESDRLISQLQDLSIDYPAEMSRVGHLFYLDEKTQRECMSRAPLLIQAAIASLERVKWEKYRRHCLEKWQALDPANTEGKEFYYQQFYTADRRIKELDQDRQFKFAELMQIPL